MDCYVDFPEFVDMFDFVIALGGSKSPFIPQLLRFGSRFVDSKKRQLRLAAFVEVNKMPIAVPRSKNCCADAGIPEGSELRLVPDAGAGVGQK